MRSTEVRIAFDGNTLCKGVTCFHFSPRRPLMDDRQARIDLYVVYTRNWMEDAAMARFSRMDRRAAPKVLYTQRF